jgi:hypothetical protein
MTMLETSRREDKADENSWEDKKGAVWDIVPYRIIFRSTKMVVKRGEVRGIAGSEGYMFASDGIPLRDLCWAGPYVES